MWHTPFSIYEMPAGVGHWGGHFFSLFLHVLEESDRIYNPGVPYIKIHFFLKIFVYFLKKKRFFLKKTKI